MEFWKGRADYASVNDVAETKSSRETKAVAAKNASSSVWHQLIRPQSRRYVQYNEVDRRYNEPDARAYRLYIQYISYYPS